MSSLTYDDVLRDRVAYGTPDMVVDRLSQLRDQLGLSGVIIESNVGGRIPLSATLGVVPVGALAPVSPMPAATDTRYFIGAPVTGLNTSGATGINTPGLAGVCDDGVTEVTIGAITYNWAPPVQWGQPGPYGCYPLENRPAIVDRLAHLQRWQAGHLRFARLPHHPHGDAGAAADEAHQLGRLRRGFHPGRITLLITPPGEVPRLCVFVP